MRRNSLYKWQKELQLKGDQASADPFLAQLDGILVQAQSNVVDAAGGPVDDQLFHDIERVHDKPPIAATRHEWTELDVLAESGEDEKPDSILRGVRATHVASHVDIVQGA